MLGVCRRAPAWPFTSDCHSRGAPRHDLFGPSLTKGNAGTPRKVAKSLSGHVTDSVYERYHIVRREDQLAAPARVEAGFTLLSLTNSTTNGPKHNSSTNGTQEVLKGQQSEGN